MDANERQNGSEDIANNNPVVVDGCQNEIGEDAGKGVIEKPVLDEVSSNDTEEVTEEESALKKAKRPRCSVCKKRLTMLEADEFQCRCGQCLCTAHRNAESHCCTFDYKKAGKRAIEKENPVVRATKVAKI